jgi:F-type H+-transporting ATPase subunit alpha
LELNEDSIAVCFPVIEVDRIKEFQGKLTEFLSTRKAELLGKIAQEKALSAALTAELKAAADQFKDTWR